MFVASTHALPSLAQHKPLLRDLKFQKEGNGDYCVGNSLVYCGALLAEGFSWLASESYGSWKRTSLGVLLWGISNARKPPKQRMEERLRLKLTVLRQERMFGC